MLLVTGANGFLGGRLARLLVERGEEVRIIHRSDGRPEYLADLPVDVVRARLEDLPSLEKAMAGVDRIFHCAARSTDWSPWREFHSANVEGVANLLRAAASGNRFERFVHVSTTDVYGYPDSPCDEDGPLVDTGLPYNRSKVMGERLVWDASRKGIPVTVLRPATIYGPRSKDFAIELENLLRQGLMMHVNGGKSGGGFIFVDDVAEAMIAAAASPDTIGKAYNIAPETDSSWREYVESMASTLGLKRPWLNLPEGAAYGLGAACEAVFRTLGVKSRPPLTRHAVRLLSRSMSFPVGKARRDFGFAPKVGLQEGVRRTSAWLRERQRG